MTELLNAPNLEERKDIFNVYSNKYKLDKEVNKDNMINNLAKQTYGFTGAMISNLYNEASIQAVRKMLRL